MLEFGLVGQTMHQVDERTPVADLTTLTTILPEDFRPVFRACRSTAAGCGWISVAFLERIEQILRQRQRDTIAKYHKALGVSGQHRGELSEAANKLQAQLVRLADHFDLIGGTSTGAIIAGALALGYSMTMVKAFYLERAEIIFPSRPWRLQFLQA